MGEMIVLRIVHVGLGVFWAGGAIFMNLIVGPALTAAGPDGFKVMQEMNKRRYFDVLLTAALLTILSGLVLVQRDSGGFNPSWFRSPFGMGISTGMVGAILSFLVAVAGIKPTLVKLSALGTAMAAASPETRGSIGAQMDAARGRLVAFGKVATLFIIIAVLAMAVARYM